MRRRDFVIVGAVLATTGCLDLGAPTQPRLAWIRLRNERPQRQAVDVIVKDGEQVVFSDTYQLAPADGEATEISLQSAVEGPGEYVVTAVVDGQQWEVDTITEATNCVGARFSFQANGQVDAAAVPTDAC